MPAGLPNFAQRLLNQTPYASIFLNTKDGPVILDIPPASQQTTIFGSGINVWQVPVVDIGPAGTDEGKGGRYVFLPPDYEGDVPKDMFPVQLDMYEVYIALRCVPLGDATFAEKTTKVKDNGGLATVVYDNLPDEMLYGTLGEEGDWLVTIGLSQADGQAALAFEGATATAQAAAPITGNGYEAWGGTSMATPHVAGVAALLWSAAPNATNVEIREAMAATALDLGEPGRDIAYGYGLVQAYDALQYLLQSSQPGKGPKKP